MLTTEYSTGQTSHTGGAQCKNTGKQSDWLPRPVPHLLCFGLGSSTGCCGLLLLLLQKHQTTMCRTQDMHGAMQQMTRSFSRCRHQARLILRVYAPNCSKSRGRCPKVQLHEQSRLTHLLEVRHSSCSYCFHTNVSACLKIVCVQESNGMPHLVLLPPLLLLLFCHACQHFFNRPSFLLQSLLLLLLLCLLSRLFALLVAAGRTRHMFARRNVVHVACETCMGWVG